MTSFISSMWYFIGKAASYLKSDMTSIQTLIYIIISNIISKRKMNISQRRGTQTGQKLMASCPHTVAHRIHHTSTHLNRITGCIINSVNHCISTGKVTLRSGYNNCTSFLWKRLHILVQ